MAKSKPARKPRAGTRSAVARPASGGVAKPRTVRTKAKAPASAAGTAAAEAAGTAGTAAAAAPAAGKPNRSPTAFEERLYAVCKCIPAGRVTTYGAMAEALHSAPRACGQALRRNPFAPTVPCHRVIAASLEIGGFSGSWGAHCESVCKKRRLLAEEGVLFDDAGRLLPSARASVMTAAELRAAAVAARVL